MNRIIYHSDNDGHASAAIVYMSLKDKGANDEDIVFHSIDHGDPIPQEINYDKDEVVLVDFSFQPIQKMIEFAEKLGKRLTWIDHHPNVEGNSVVLEDAEGCRLTHGSKGPVAACELVWWYYYPKGEMPKAISLVGDWDTWRWKKMHFRRRQEVQGLMYALLSFDSDPSFFDGDIHGVDGRSWWLNAFKSDGFAQSEIEDGIKFWDYQKQRWKEYMKGYSFEATFKYKGLRAIIVNKEGNSEMFNGFYDPEKHDVMVTYRDVRGEYLTMSMYTTHEHLHMGEICKTLGEAGDRPSGGGHPGAGGFQCGFDYFRSLWSKCCVEE